MNKHSLILVPVETVMKAATNASAYADAKRDEYRKQCVTEAMKPRRHWFFWTKTRNLEEAERWCSRVTTAYDIPFPEDPYFHSGPSSWAKDWSQKTFRALFATKSDVCYLSAEDAENVSFFSIRPQ